MMAGERTLQWRPARDRRATRQHCANGGLISGGDLPALPLPEPTVRRHRRGSRLADASRPMTVPGAAIAIAVASTLESWRRLPGH